MSLMRAIIDKLLTNVSNSYQAQGFISEMLLPMISTAQYSGKLGGYGTNHLKLENALGGGLGAYKNVNPVTTTMTNYDIGSYGLEGFVSPRDRANFELPFDAEADLTAGLTSLLIISKEVTLANALRSTAIMSQNTTLTGTNQWSDYTNSNPIGDINTGKAVVKASTGALPNFLILDWATANVLRYHPQLLNNLGFKDSRPGGLTANEMAMAFDLPKVFVPTCNYDSAKEGQASVFSPIWGKDVIIGVAPDTAGPFQASLGYRLQKAGKTPRRVFKYGVNNPPDTTAILVDDEYQHFLSNVKAGYLIKTAIA